MRLPDTDRGWDYADDDRPLRHEDDWYEPIDDVPDWHGDEDVCPCCGDAKPNLWDECRDCFTSGRLRDFTRHPSTDE